MNHISATIKSIEAFDGITIVAFETEGQQMKMMALELAADLDVGSEVILGVKASNISIAKAPLGRVSISNQPNITIETVDNGKLLSVVSFRLGRQLLESIITRDSSERLDLQVGDKAIALIKSSELSILGSQEKL